MDSISMLAIALTVTFALASVGWSVYVVVVMFHDWNKARLYRNRPRGATRRSFK